MKHIGILAHSADGAALCFLEMVREGARKLGAHEHPEITLAIRPMGPTLPWWEAGELDKINASFMVSAEKLAAAKCDFFVVPDNTAHIALDVAPAFPLPGLHICRIVAERAKADGRKRVALLGTRWTMEGPAYPRAFERAGIELRTPPKAERDLINRLILDELCQGEITDGALREFLRIIETLKGEGCDAVALSCTEIPLLITSENSPLPTLDSTRLLAREAIAVALGEKPMPSWRGGPI